MKRSVVKTFMCYVMLLCITLLWSCGSNINDTPSHNSDNSDISQTAPAEFPNEKIDFGGKTIKLLADQYLLTAGFPDEEIIPNAIYNRAQLISQEYGLNIEIVPIDYRLTVENHSEYIKNAILSDTNDFHGIVSSLGYMAPIATEGLLYDFNSLDNGYMHMNSPWWDQNLISQTKLNNKNFFLTGDAFIEDEQNTWVMYFNEDLIQKHNLENPYDLVESGDWTLDKMYEMLKVVEYTEGEIKHYDDYFNNVWGLVCDSYSIHAFMQGSGQKIMEYSDGIPVISITNDDNVETLNKCTEILYDFVNVGVEDYHGSWGEFPDRYYKIFAKGNALFMPESLHLTETSVMQDVQCNYGFVPMPKGDKEQTDYYSSVNVYQCPVFCIPTTTTGDMLDATCYAMEALAFHGEDIHNEYFISVLADSDNKGNKSWAMLDLIMGNRTFDMGSALNLNNGKYYTGSQYFYMNVLGIKSKDILETYKTFESNIQGGYDKLLNDLENNIK